MTNHRGLPSSGTPFHDSDFQHLEQRTQDGDVRREAGGHHQRVAHHPASGLGDDRRRGLVHALEDGRVVAHRHEALVRHGFWCERRRQIPGLQSEDVAHVIRGRDGRELDRLHGGSAVNSLRDSPAAYQPLQSLLYPHASQRQQAFTRMSLTLPQRSQHSCPALASARGAASRGARGEPFSAVGIRVAG